MKKIIPVLIILFSVSFCSAQNLVPNPSFEDTVYCPVSIDSMSACAEWHSAGQFFYSSPNYFNTCSSNPNDTPPLVQIGGYQVPHSGNAYCGLITYEIFTEMRETIQATLIEPLVIGQKYFVSFYFSLMDIYPQTVATNKLGALFTTYLFTPTNFATPQNFAQVYSDSIFTDTLNWIHFKSSFIADSAYQFISLGNFFDDAHIDTLNMGNSPLESWYFIDDVCVSTDSLECYFPEGINKISNQSISIYPNPSSDKIFINSNNNENFEYALTTVFGETVKCNTKSTSAIDVSAIPSGIYFLQLRTKNNSVNKKIVVQH